MYGELIPLGGGDPIPLLKKRLIVGRRESCDIVLRFSNVSAQHCELFVVSGYWYVRDLHSTNGIKVNGTRVRERRLDPGNILSIAKHQYEIRYNPIELGAVGPPPPDTLEQDIFARSLLERAGLVKSKPQPEIEESEKEESLSGDDGDRYDVLEGLRRSAVRKTTGGT
ncbi:MAG: FHA domain-containing protein [Thermogutta sp.]